MIFAYYYMMMYFLGGSQVCKVTILKKHRETDNGFISNDYSGAGP